MSETSNKERPDSIDLPPTVVKGQEFDVVIRRITTRIPPILIGFRPKAAQAEPNWRYVIGTFQVKIPVSTADAILPDEENTLAIFK